MPFSPFYLLLFILLLSTLLAIIQIGALTIAFGKLGLSTDSAFLLLFCSLFGSAINLPLFSVRAERPPEAAIPQPLRGLLRHSLSGFTGKTIVAINVGGGMVPIMFSFYLLKNSSIDFTVVALATALVSAVCYFTSRPIVGIGVGMPILIAPLSAALVAIVLDGDQSAPLAYISGTLGVLIGADILRLRDIRRMGTPLASIGGAGTFDGIFLTGIVAVLLA